MALFDKFRKMLIVDAPASDKGQMLMGQVGKQAQISQLTPREHDLYLLLLEGFTLKESAKRLGVKYSTANTHMSGIYKKLGVRSRAELIINYRDFTGGN